MRRACQYQWNVKRLFRIFLNNQEVQFWLFDWIWVTRNNKEISQYSIFYNVLLKGFIFLKSNEFYKSDFFIVFGNCSGISPLLIFLNKNVRRKITVSLPWFQSLYKSEITTIPYHKLLRMVYTSFTINMILNSHFTEIA